MSLGATGIQLGELESQKRLQDTMFSQPRHIFYSESSWLRRVRNALLVIVAVTLSARLLNADRPLPNSALWDVGNTSGLGWNGTHWFNKTVIMVSIDGMRYDSSDLAYLSHSPPLVRRADYLDRGLTPHLLKMGQFGLRAKHMKPIFPASPSPVIRISV